ncbi:hypothetical protein [Halorubrum sp. Ea1]|uniref:hypothetical protein n=1 Tax=Halorubrum sp. Ea1 TaxID=1480718 RepID=UPI0015962D5C|nr:hypothetical protein [Halorubrum sp. Ea1]
MSLTRLIAYSVLTVAVACLLVMWGLFGMMYAHGTTQITTRANIFNEFVVELVVE